MELRGFQEMLSQRLLRWGQLNVALGMALWLSGRPFWRGFGSQAVGWGAVNAGIALWGRRSNRKKEKDLQANTPAALAKEAAGLRRLLGINAALDVLYIVGGLRVVHSGGEKWRGHGWGIVFQGGFLLLFDLAQAWRTPQEARYSRDSAEDLGMTNLL
ncbi:MAG: hypothetical protein Fur0021_37930 [Candidatus Promineifilaceae bacterium]